MSAVPTFVRSASARPHHNRCQPSPIPLPTAMRTAVRPSRVSTDAPALHKPRDTRIMPRDDAWPEDPCAWYLADRLHGRPVPDAAGPE
jgi:hypothetical protein